MITEAEIGGGIAYGPDNNNITARYEINHIGDGNFSAEALAAKDAGMSVDPNYYPLLQEKMGRDWAPENIASTCRRMENMESGGNSARPSITIDLMKLIMLLIVVYLSVMILVQVRLLFSIPNIKNESSDVGD
jgi:hypothetical protein